MSRFEEFLEANAAFAATFDQDHLRMSPAHSVALVACRDARLHSEKVLGLAIGDAHDIRNAGGRAADAIRSLIISEGILGTTEIVVLQHTDCSMLTFTNEQLAAKVHVDLDANVSRQDFLPFSDLEQSVRDDVATLRSSPLTPSDIPISGAIYDGTTGKVHEVVRA